MPVSVEVPICGLPASSVSVLTLRLGRIFRIVTLGTVVLVHDFLKSPSRFLSLPGGFAQIPIRISHLVLVPSHCIEDDTTNAPEDEPDDYHQPEYTRVQDA